MTNKMTVWSYTRGVAAVGLGCAVLCMVACAPEPVSPAGQPVKGVQLEAEGERWSAPVEDLNLSQKNTDLPEGFPSEAFQFSDSAQIDDVGQYSAQSWYLVVRTESIGDANAFVEEALLTNNLTVATKNITVDGGVAGVSENEAFSVEFLTLNDAEQGALSSFVLTQNAG